MTYRRNICVSSKVAQTLDMLIGLSIIVCNYFYGTQNLRSYNLQVFNKRSVIFIFNSVHSKCIYYTCIILPIFILKIFINN